MRRVRVDFHQCEAAPSMRGFKTQDEYRAGPYRMEMDSDESDGADQTRRQAEVD